MQIEEFFEENNRIAVAFSGGVDSTYLLYAAVKAGADVLVAGSYVFASENPEARIHELHSL